MFHTFFEESSERQKERIQRPKDVSGAPELSFSLRKSFPLGILKVEERHRPAGKRFPRELKKDQERFTAPKKKKRQEAPPEPVPFLLQRATRD